MATIPMKCILIVLFFLFYATPHAAGPFNSQKIANAGGDAPGSPRIRPTTRLPIQKDNVLVSSRDLQSVSPAQVSSFHIDGDSYVVFCRSEPGVMSEIFKFNRSAQSFNLFQRLPTLGCHDINPFLGIDNQQMLCLASHRRARAMNGHGSGGKGTSSRSNGNSKRTKKNGGTSAPSRAGNNYINILQYNGRGDNFVMFDMFEKANSLQCDTIIVVDKETKEMTLMIAVTTNQGVSIYRMSSDGIMSSEGAFEELEAYNIRDTETFYVDGVPHIAVGVGICDGRSQSNTLPQTKIWKWDFSLKKFFPSQTIPVPQSVSKSGKVTTPTCLEELEFFTRGGESYLVSVYSGGHLSSTVLHKWDRKRLKFVISQKLIHSKTIHDAEIFDILGETYLILSHVSESGGNLYVWDSTVSEFQFKEILDNLETKGVNDMKAFQISNKQFLAIAKEDHNTIYRLTQDDGRHFDMNPTKVDDDTNDDHRRVSPRDIDDIVSNTITSTLEARRSHSVPTTTTINVTIHHRNDNALRLPTEPKHIFLYGAALGMVLLIVAIVSCACIGCSLLVCILKQSPCEFYRHYRKHLRYHIPGVEGVEIDSDSESSWEHGYPTISIAKEDKRVKRHHHHRHHTRHHRHRKYNLQVGIPDSSGDDDSILSVRPDIRTSYMKKRKHETDDDDDNDAYHDRVRRRISGSHSHKHDSDSESCASSSSSSSSSYWESSSRVMVGDEAVNVTRRDVSRKRDEEEDCHDDEKGKGKGKERRRRFDFDFNFVGREELKMEFEYEKFHPVVSNIGMDTDGIDIEGDGRNRQGEEDHFMSPTCSPYDKDNGRRKNERRRKHKHKHGWNHGTSRDELSSESSNESDLILDDGPVTNPGFIANRSHSILKSDEELRREQEEGGCDEPHVFHREVSTDGGVEMTNELDEEYSSSMFIQRLKQSSSVKVTVARHE